MKTTEKEYTLENPEIKTTNLRLNPLKSLRPQKSMMRIKSLKPKRLNIASKISIKSSKV
jgi:hypothetical protein